jgi:hypothetical protein
MQIHDQKLQNLKSRPQETVTAVATQNGGLKLISVTFKHAVTSLPPVTHQIATAIKLNEWVTTAVKYLTCNPEVLVRNPDEICPQSSQYFKTCYGSNTPHYSPRFIANKLPKQRRKTINETVLPATTMKHARHSVVNIRFADGRPG